jgi:hypothetical protein
MAKVTDPLCGMRIEDEDVVSTVEHGHDPILGLPGCLGSNPGGPAPS